MKKIIKPFTKPFTGQRVALPGSKSLTNRALILAALGKGPITLTGALFAQDTLIMTQALRALGFEITANPAAQTISLMGLGGIIPNATAKLFVGNAGTAARFLPALCALHPHGEYEFEGLPAMEQRPMKELLDVLCEQGCSVHFHKNPDHFPFTLKTQGLRGGNWSVDGKASSQFFSALRMVASYAKDPAQLSSLQDGPSTPFIRMTEQLMAQFGYSKENPCPTHPLTYSIEKDWTQASYFAALTLIVGGSLLLEGLTDSALQGDRTFLNLLSPLGLSWKFTPEGLLLSGQLEPLKEEAQYGFLDISDTFPTLAILTPFLKKRTYLYGIAHTAKQESNRPLAMETGLQAAGQSVHLNENGLEIQPSPLRPCIIDPHGDHRIAMSFAILGSYNLDNGKPWLTVLDTQCVDKTFPEFFTTLEKLHHE